MKLKGKHELKSQSVIKMFFKATMSEIIMRLQNLYRTNFLIAWVCVCRKALCIVVCHRVFLYYHWRVLISDIFLIVHSVPLELKFTRTNVMGCDFPPKKSEITLDLEVSCRKSCRQKSLSGLENSLIVCFCYCTSQCCIR